MSLKFVMVSEAEEDFETGMALADQVILDPVPVQRDPIHWIEEETIDHYREWITSHDGHLLTWTSIALIANRLRIKAYGHFEGEPALIYGRAARNAIRVVKACFDPLDALVLICDTDDQPERRDGLRQAREAENTEFPVVIGCAIIERECWILSGFEPGTEQERELLDQERQNLGFDPRLKSHELTDGKNDQGRKSAKRVCEVLTANNLDRQRECWRKTELKTLRERGQENGLTEYLAEIEERLVPLFQP
jgi:hypothetical protein